MALEYFQIIGNLPTMFSIGLSGASLILAFWLNRKKIDIEEKTSLGTTQAKQVEMLMSQIVMLSGELEKTREQLADLHEQNIELMGELRRANRRISELENAIDNSNTHMQ